MYSSEDKVYCYPDSAILKNLLDIRDAVTLAEAEGYIVGLRMAELVRGPPTFDFSFQFLKVLHRRLFQDVYEWTGATRRVDMTKGAYPLRSLGTGRVRSCLLVRLHCDEAGSGLRRCAAVVHRHDCTFPD